MSTYSAGKVSVTPRGQYSASTQYERLDVVSDNGSSYMYINKTPDTGVSLSTATHWMEIAEKGATGDTGPQGEQGIQGVPGQDGSGVPAGGTAGQVLSKVDNTDHNVAWTDQTGGGGGGGKNILHNWDFRRPVNQRDVSGSISAVGYVLDRWRLVSGTVTVAAGYLTLENGAVLEQRIEGLYLAGETVTVSVQTDAEIISGTSVFPTAAGSVDITLAGLGAATLGYNAGYMFVRFTADADRNLMRVKAELGTVSTLHLDPPMDHAAELPKCQRYFLRYDRAMPALGVGYMDTATNARFSVHLPVGMRVRPSIAYTALDNFMAVCNGILSTLSDLYVNTASGSELWLNTTTITALSAHHPAVLRITADNDITFSADL